MPNDYFPPREHFPTEDQWQAHVQTLKQVYAIRDLVQKHARDIQAATSNIRQIQQQPAPGGPGNTLIGGLALQPSQPTDGQVLKFSAKSGQIVWG
jgi:hypothetical protein